MKQQTIRRNKNGNSSLHDYNCKRKKAFNSNVKHAVITIFFLENKVANYQTTLTCQLPGKTKVFNNNGF